MEINILAVFLAALSAFVLGGAWYSPALFGKTWQQETGVDSEKIKPLQVLVAHLSWPLSRHLSLPCFWGRIQNWGLVWGQVSQLVLAGWRRRMALITCSHNVA